MDTLFWRPHLGPLTGGIVLLCLLGWLLLLYRRYRRRYPRLRAISLLVPRSLILALLLLAMFDPVWGLVEQQTEKVRVLVASDRSASMMVDDGLDDTRDQRARGVRDQLESELGGAMDFQQLVFDTDISDPDEQSAPASDTARGTDLGRTLVGLAERPDLSTYFAIVMITDGGDEQIIAHRIPRLPMHIVGVGGDPDNWNDLIVGTVEAPPEVEKRVDFDINAEILAYARPNFEGQIRSVPVRIEELDGSEWNQIERRDIDLLARRERLTFTVPGRDVVEDRRFRISVDVAEGEQTDLNNLREVSVPVRDKKAHVLLFTRSVGWDVNAIRQTLDRDPGVSLTSITRVTGERYFVQGDRQKNDETIESGFPKASAVLDLYKVVILGSFPAGDLSREQQAALREYVERGGSLIALGGEESFGRGGFADSVLSPLFPWVLSGAEREMERGTFPVSMPGAVAEQDLIRGFSSAMADAGQMSLVGVNFPGNLKTAAFSLLDASVAGETVGVIALHPYGEGQVLGIATNTLWKWSRGGERRRAVYNTFWKHGIRYMAGLGDGGRYLRVKWDRKHYRPSEQADITVNVAGSYRAGELRISAARTFEDHSEPISVEAFGARAGAFRCQTLFERRGSFRFEIHAFVGDRLLETYEKIIEVGPKANEGAQLEVNHAFLESLAAKTTGSYVTENQVETLVESLRSQIKRESVMHDIVLVQHKYLYLIAFMLALIGEWIWRRRLNLF
ncbi:MAG: hypothetical protein ACI8W8_001536 [Rhodothermales bacterium]